jgi:8-oxo-dGTP pyrophosphatase MutT (NUDIX family)
MTGRIRPLALVVVRRPSDGAILAAPGSDNLKEPRFYRPLGGEIEFGELAEDAARREIREEIGAELADLRLLGIFENHFTFLGEQGHELVWVYEGAFVNPSLYEREVIECDEYGEKFEAHWVPPGIFERGEMPLYPDGLWDLLTTGRKT